MSLLQIRTPQSWSQDLVTSTSTSRSSLQGAIGPEQSAHPAPDSGNYDIFDFIQLNSDPAMTHDDFVPNNPSYTHDMAQISSPSGSNLQFGPPPTFPQASMGSSGTSVDFSAAGYYDSIQYTTDTTFNVGPLPLQSPGTVVTVDGYTSLLSTGDPSAPITNSITTPDLRPLVHRKKRLQRAGIDEKALAEAFYDGSVHPDPDRRNLFETILKSDFYKKQNPEPVLGTSNATAILSSAGTSALGNHAPPNVSIFVLFVDREKNMCLICGKTCAAIERLVGCVRKHFNHRPFACRGQAAGCTKCSTSQSARFFMASAVRDHMAKQKNTDQCPNCGTPIRIGGIPRHYKSMHPLVPVPNMKVERAHLRQSSAAL
ncbi:hypothetical protein FRC20_010244 [Serendipita sp. 405]|nr:hypothetical protein FRC20_010244 [Serendipita sp. 405]